jgi:hypothetical protein
MLGSKRLTRRKLGWSEPLVGGTKVPSSRKGLMLAIVRREEAEGERRMIGSRRRELGGGGRDGRVGRLLVEGLLALRRRVIKSSDCFRTWEKSYCSSLAYHPATPVVG